jgi:hypothetical protein
MANQRGEFLGSIPRLDSSVRVGLLSGVASNAPPPTRNVIRHLSSVMTAEQHGISGGEQH